MASGNGDSRVEIQCEPREEANAELSEDETMARNDETRVGGYPRLFQVDPSWYEREWLQEPTPRKPGTFAFFRRILAQLRSTRRQDARVRKSPDQRDCVWHCG